MELCLIPVRTIRWLKCYQDLSGVGVVHRRKNCHYSADYGARYDRVSCRAPAWHQCKPDIQMAQAILRRFTDGCCIGRGSGAGLRNSLPPISKFANSSAFWAKDDGSRDTQRGRGVRPGKNGLRMRPRCPGTTNKRRLQKSWRVACAVEHSGSPAI